MTVVNELSPLKYLITDAATTRLAGGGCLNRSGRDTSMPLQLGPFRWLPGKR
jgi:hypothetical protein